MRPIVHGLEDTYGDRINFIYLDIDDPRTEELKEALRYRFQPHFILLDAQGNQLKTWTGLVSEEILSAAFDEALTGNESG